jgi:hypothetical protein
VGVLDGVRVRVSCMRLCVGVKSCVMRARTKMCPRLGGLQWPKMMRVLWMYWVFLESASVSQLSRIMCLGAENPGW